MSFLETVRAERSRVAGMRAALDGRIAALDQVIASYELMPALPSLPAGEVEAGDHDHPQMLDARVAVPASVPVRIEAENLGHSSATGSAGEEIPDHSESGSPSGNPPPPPAPTQVSSPAPSPAVESAAGTNLDPGLPGVTPSPSAPEREAVRESRAQPAAVEGAAGTIITKPMRKGYGHAPVLPRREAPRPKPATSSLPTARDPLLARETEFVPSSRPLSADEHPGSPGQQLAARILADMPALMKDHLRGPIRADLAERYGVPPARVNEAVITLFGRRQIRLERFGGSEQHIVPPGFEPEPSSERPAARPAMPSGEETATQRNCRLVLQTLRSLAAGDGTVEIAMSEIARRSGATMGSMGFTIPTLVKQQAIEVVRKPTSSTPAVYRVLSPTPAGA